MVKHIENQFLKLISFDIDSPPLSFEAKLAALLIFLISWTAIILIWLKSDILKSKSPAKRAQHEAKVEKKRAGQKMEPQQRSSVDRLEKTKELLEEIRMSKTTSKSKIALDRKIENLASNKRVEYLLSVTPSQFVRDADDRVSDNTSLKSVNKSVSWWSGISSVESLNDAGADESNIDIGIEGYELSEEDKFFLRNMNN